MNSLRIFYHNSLLFLDANIKTNKEVLCICIVHTFLCRLFTLTNSTKYYTFVDCCLNNETTQGKAIRFFLTRPKVKDLKESRHKSRPSTKRVDSTSSSYTPGGSRLQKSGRYSHAGGLTVFDLGNFVICTHCRNSSYFRSSSFQVPC